MQKIKKILPLFLIMAFVSALSFIACDDNKNDPYLGVWDVVDENYEQQTKFESIDTNCDGTEDSENVTYIELAKVISDRVYRYNRVTEGDLSGNVYGQCNFQRPETGLSEVTNNTFSLTTVNGKMYFIKRDNSLIDNLKCQYDGECNRSK